MFGAGTDTTANTLVVGTWNIVSEPRILQRLKDELWQAMPDKDDTLDWATLENLPYLVCTFVLHHSVSGRLTNVTHSELSSRKAFDSLMVHREDFRAWFLPPEQLSVVEQSHRGYVDYNSNSTRSSKIAIFFANPSKRRQSSATATTSTTATNPSSRIHTPSSRNAGSTTRLKSSTNTCSASREARGVVWG